MTEIQEQKKILRKQALLYRNSLSKEESLFLNRKIQVNFPENHFLKNAGKILCYHAKDKIEISTDIIIEKALFYQKELCFPLCDMIKKKMTFYQIHSLKDLKKGCYNIMEPDSEICPKMTDFNRNDICIVPALSVDKNGFRLGWGGGYYDRFLKDFPGRKIGLCFENNLVETLPHESTDIQLDTLLTENQIYRFTKENIT